MVKVKKRPQEFLFGERVYNVVKGANGKGNVYGVCYVSKDLIGEKVILKKLNEEDLKSIEIVKREYSLKKKKKSERRLKT